MQAGMAFQNLFFSGIGITNTTHLQPNFGPFFAFRTFFKRKTALIILDFFKLCVMDAMNLFHDKIVVSNVFQVLEAESSDFS
jgi:L-2-hydroxyglutarate oxidase LhgO